MSNFKNIWSNNVDVKITKSNYKMNVKITVFISKL